MGEQMRGSANRATSSNPSNEWLETSYCVIQTNEREAVHLEHGTRQNNFTENPSFFFYYFKNNCKSHCFLLPNPMASSSATAPLYSSSSVLIDRKPPRQQAIAAASPHCVSLPSLVPPPTTSQSRPQNRESWKTTAYCRRIARNVVAMATGDVLAEVGTDLPDILKTVQEAWDKVEDKYAITSLGISGIVALWGTTGMISAIDRLPLVPSLLEVVGIGYTGWFAYKNLIFKPDREALIRKIKDSYNEIIGSS